MIGQTCWPWWIVVDAQCVSGKYGADCSCTSDLAAALDSAPTTVLTCANGVWTSTGPVVINKLVDMMYDTLSLPDTGADSSIFIPSYGNLTMHFWENTNGTLRQAYIVSNGTFEAQNGTVWLSFDNQEAGSWSIQLASYEGGQVAASSPIVTAAFNLTQVNCRSQTTPTTTVFGDFEARYNYNVTSTRSKCGFAKGSRDWAMWIWCAIAGLGVLFIIFTIVTCCIHPLKKKIWYPPM